MPYSIGINIGSSNFKAVLCDRPQIIDTLIHPVYEPLAPVLEAWLAKHKLLGQKIPIQGTGMADGWKLNIPRVSESYTITPALDGIGIDHVRAILSLGGETLLLFTLNPKGGVSGCLTGSKCAVGTGEFMRQQLQRMNLALDDLKTLTHENLKQAISSRCSVFMKSDCTHRLNKGESTPREIALLLCRMIAEQATHFINRADLKSGKILITGGLAQVPVIRDFLAQINPKIEFIVPENALCFEAYGAAQMAQTAPTATLSANLDELFEGVQALTYPQKAPLKEALHLVDVRSADTQPLRPDVDYILGVDGGSTTTKAALIALDNGEITAVHYDRTLGDPVRAFKRCLAEIMKQLNGAKVNIPYLATTGSSRELLGAFTNASGVYNEIEAHAAGAQFFIPEADTILEIGGQDAKFMQLHNGVPINYVMNEACSAGTGSFLEEAAAGDLGIKDCRDIGPAALEADAVLDFGEHCSAFINTDIRKALRQGASRNSVIAGMVSSVVLNYLKRVCGQRTLGKHILLQGGVAKNLAVPVAFAQRIKAKITVPPFPELAGAIGVALLLRRKINAGIIPASNFDLDELFHRTIEPNGTFRCQSCENQCEIRRLKCGVENFNFGGRCSKFARSRSQGDGAPGIDFIHKRNEIFFAPPKIPTGKSRGKVGLPRVLSDYALHPFYAGFLSALNFEVVSPERCNERHNHRLESSYCFPVELAHAAVQELIQAGVDYLFIPMLQETSSMVHEQSGCSCPLTLSAPIYLPRAFPEFPSKNWMMPHFIFSDNVNKLLPQLESFALQFNLSTAELTHALHAGIEAQKAVLKQLRTLGEEAMDAIENHEGILLAGHPYNAISPDANLSIPKKLTSRGYHVIPYDILPGEHLNDYSVELYWFHFQKALSGAVYARQRPNLHLVWITNFSCAPDSFTLHYLQRFYGNRPYLVLELDSHSADAGVDTRIEAFLDIKSEYFAQKTPMVAPENLFVKKTFAVKKGGKIAIKNQDFKPLLHNRDVEILITNPQGLEIEVFTRLMREAGLNFTALAQCAATDLDFAKPFISGKECLPAQLLLGSLLRFVASETYDTTKNYLMFVPDTCGPCRTGQYKHFYANLLEQLNLKNIHILSLHSDESYADFGKIFGIKVFEYVALYDFLLQIKLAVRQTAIDPVSAYAEYQACVRRHLLEPTFKSARARHAELVKFTTAIGKIPVRTIENPVTVHIVGEFFVRLDEFSSHEIVDYLTHNGVDRVYISSATEWLEYLDTWRVHMEKRRMKHLPFFKRISPHEIQRRFALNIEMRIKHHIIRKMRRIFAPCEHLLAPAVDVREVMKYAEKNFMPQEIGSEINISSGIAGYLFQQKRTQGIIIMAPFACLIGRSLEGILKPWARKDDMPVLAIETDGNPQPPSSIRALDIFIHRACAQQRKKNIYK